jgi:hypothetical protein
MITSDTFTSSPEQSYREGNYHDLNHQYSKTQNMNMESSHLVSLLLQVSGLTPGRAAAIVPAVLGLISVVIGWSALARSSGRVKAGRRKAIIALVLGLTDIFLSSLHLARITGGIGTGSGKLGAIVATVLGLIGIALGALAMARFRRMKKANL